jgi:thiol-disulfide isomerase/thioredoxin/outer membrane lipoprotein-sorting protein
MLTRFCYLPTVAAFGLFIAPAFAAPAAPGSGANDSSAKAQPQNELAKKVQKAYQALDQYHAKHDGVMRMQMRGGESNEQSRSSTIAYDRQGDRLRLDMGETFTLVSDGKTLSAYIAGYKGHHLETKAPDPLDSQNLRQTMPFLGQTASPDLAMLIDQAPIAAIAGQPDAKAKTVEVDAENTLGLEVPTVRGQPVTLHIDPDSHLITKAVRKIDTAQHPQVDSATVTVEYDIQAQNETLDDKLFALETDAKSKPVDSAEKLADKYRQAMQGGSGGGGGGGHPLAGKAAPDFEVTTMDGQSFKLSEAKADVVVLDFWATWCPPCRKGLPKLQSIHDWAKKQSKSVAIYPVNVKEDKQKAQNYWDQQKFTMPVLLDSDGQVSQKYKVSGIPQTVIIADGQVKKVYVGLVPGMEMKIKEQIDAALSEK